MITLPPEFRHRTPRPLTWLAAASLMACLSAAAPALAQSASDGEPRSVDRLLRLHKDVATGAIRFLVDDADGDRKGDLLRSGQTFLADGTIKVTFRALNPLRQRVTSTVESFDSPQATLVAQLVEGLASVPRTVPVSGGMAGLERARNDGQPSGAENALLRTSCDAFDAAVGSSLKGLVTLMTSSDSTSPAALRDKYAAWADEIDRHFASTTESVRGDRIIVETKTAIAAFAQSLTDDAGRIAELATAIADYIKANEGQCGTMAAYASREVNTGTAWVERLRALAGVLVAFAGQLDKTFGQRDDWVCPNSSTVCDEFIVAADVNPSFMQGARLAISVSDLTIGWANAIMTTTAGTPVNVTFDVTQRMTWRPEVGVGATFGFLTQPKYGTATNDAGDTIVARAEPTRVSFTPSVLLNFVPQSHAGPVPMIQVGVSTSTSAPAVFFGGGWRSPGTTGGLAVGIGLMLGWVKDLTTLKPDDVINGTKDIENDFKFDPKPRPTFYLNIQYKFGT